MAAPADDRYFGGKDGGAQKAHASMVKQHGERKGNRIYLQTLTKRRARGTGLRKAMDDRKRRKKR